MPHICPYLLPLLGSAATRCPAAMINTIGVNTLTLADILVKCSELISKNQSTPADRDRPARAKHPDGP
jgi:hypothetical protein